MVATTLNRPLAMLSTASSMSCSPDFGSFRSSYMLLEDTEVDAAGSGLADEAEAMGTWAEDEREKSDGSRTMKSRCWSKTWHAIQLEPLRK